MTNQPQHWRHDDGDGSTEVDAEVEDAEVGVHLFLLLRQRELKTISTALTNWTQSQIGFYRGDRWLVVQLIE